MHTDWLVGGAHPRLERFALSAMLKMATHEENIATILLILLGVIIVPILFIWSADTIFALTIKTFVAAFFLLLLIRAVPRKKDDPRHRQSTGKDEES